jgi:putative addiction module component (TIGR02574 family)
MNAIAKKLLDRALELEDTDRAELAALLISSLDPHIDHDVEAAWDAEIKRRLDQIDSGEVTTIPWPEARRMIMGSTSESSTD